MPSELHGRVVESVWTSYCGLAIQFADGTVALYKAEGDCCAYAWIEHAEIYDFKGPIISAVAAGSSVLQELKNEYLDQEFITFRTEYGRLIIDLRVSHNGAYGGSLNYCGLSHGLSPSSSWKEVA